MRVGYLGPQTSFSNEAALKIYPKGELIPFVSINEVFSALENGIVSKIVVPIENSNGGSICETLDKLIEKDFFVIKEFYLKINQYFLSRQNIEKINTIYSHPQAFSQCSNWIEKNTKGKKLIETNSTSQAAEKASIGVNCGAIASKLAAKKFGLDVIEENINNSKENITKFFVISRSKNVGNFKKMSIIFGVNDKPGSLLNVLESFKNNEINMTKIESRPSKRKNWEYLFFVELICDKDCIRINESLKEITQKTSFLKNLGSY